MIYISVLVLKAPFAVYRFVLQVATVSSEIFDLQKILIDMTKPIVSSQLEMKKGISGCLNLPVTESLNLKMSF
jgi:hypothetical protein